MFLVIAPGSQIVGLFPALPRNVSELRLTEWVREELSRRDSTLPDDLNKQVNFALNEGSMDDGHVETQVLKAMGRVLNEVDSFNRLVIQGKIERQ